jgi:spermidine/putrescine transport system ATP-binding protein
MLDAKVNQKSNLESSGIAVELRDVVKRFGDVTAVDHVSIRIKDGEFFSLLGPSGCGKTTTLRMIAGFEMATSGQILIEGEPQGYLPPHRRPVNTVFQNYALFPHMNVYDNVAFGLQMQGVSKKETVDRVMGALELVHLKGMQRRRPRQLSGGQQQRVALARALVNKPKVLLLDEPLGALDLKLRKAMQLELKTLQDEVGITFVYVTHDQEEALTMSDRIAVMSKGRLLQVGEPQEIYESPQSRFVADFIGETNLIPGEITHSDTGVGILLFGDAHTTAGWAEDGLTIGDRGLLSIRPEKVHIYPIDYSQTPPHMTHVEARVQQVIYVGTDTRYVLELPNGVTLAGRQQNTIPGGGQFNTGEGVILCWDPDHARILRE